MQPFVRPVLTGISSLLALVAVACGATPDNADPKSSVGSAVAGATCGALPPVTTHDLTSITNTAYLEASYLDREGECAEVAATILARAAAPDDFAFGVGNSVYDQVISARNQFETYDYHPSIIDGTPISEYSWAFGNQYADDQFESCQAAVRRVVSSVPESGYLYFVADGEGYNTFRHPVDLPAGCNLLK